jgi:hypothetical protein
MYTALDAIEYLMSSTGGGAQDQEHRLLRQALFHGYRDLVTARDSWKWYHTSDKFNLGGQNSIVTYLLPWGVNSVDSLVLPLTNVSVAYVAPMEWDRLLNSQWRNLTRIVWTILPSKSSPDRFEVKVFNGFAVDDFVTLTYRRRPRDLRFTGWEPQARAGTIEWDGSVIQGTGTTFTNLMMGSVIRVSADPKKHPESLQGMNAYSDEALIQKVDDQDTIHVWSPMGQLKYPPGTKYIITDYLDISPQMYTALLSGAEVWLAKLAGKNLEGAMGVYGRDLRMAFENDVMAPISGQRQSSPYGYYSFWYLRAGADQGVPGSGNGGGTVTPPPPPEDGRLDGGNAAGTGGGTVDGGGA